MVREEVGSAAIGRPIREMEPSCGFWLCPMKPMWAVSDDTVRLVSFDSRGNDIPTSSVCQQG
jgi:hypothetical protein